MSEAEVKVEETEVKPAEEATNGNGAGDAPANGSAAAAAASPDVEKRIIRQVEHYFGDYNLPRDKFLLEQIKAAEGGWVPMETMLKFQRLAALSPDAAVIMKALKSSSSGLLEVDEAEKRIRRVPDKPVPEYDDARKELLQSCTVYIKGFDKEATQLDDVIDFFADHDVLNVQMRHYVDKKKKDKKDARGFKGSVFVVFKDKESAEKFMALDKVEYKGQELTGRTWQSEYFEMKKKEFEDLKKEQLDRKKKVKEAKEAAEKVKDEDEEEKEEEEGLPTGTVLYLKGLNDETRREDIRERLEELFEVQGTDVAFIYFNKGESEAKLRFKRENHAVEVSKMIPQGEFEIKGTSVQSSVLEGDEEKAFLKKCLEEMKAWKKKGKGGHKRKGGFRGGGRGAKRQRT